MSTVIAVINQKGGVGKTTTSINLSSGIARKGIKTLLVDLDPQAHSTIGLGFEPGNSQVALHEVFLKKKTLSDIIVSTTINNLFLAPSNIRLDKVEQQLSPEMFRETLLDKAIKPLKDYKVIVIDCRPTLGTLTINALYACNFIIVPCEISRYALDGFSDLMETIEYVKQNQEQEKHLRILLTKFDSRNKISNDWVFNQLKNFKPLMLNTFIRKNEALNQAHMAQENIFTFSPLSPGAQDYEQLTQELLSLCHQ
jgi:chromosome partitioning protein